MNNKTKRYAFWISTVLFSLAMLGSAFADLTRQSKLVEGFAHLGYPASLMLLLGVWKVLGVVAINVPGFARLKEWAYAGFFFELSGALFAHGTMADGAQHWAPPAVLLVLGATSWALRAPSPSAAPALATPVLHETKRAA